MKRFILAFTYILLIGFSCNTYAQSSSQAVLGSAGDFATFTNGSMSWTIGEVIADTYSSSGHIFTQGFHQPDTMFLTIVQNLAFENISVYSNPVFDNLTIDLSLSSGNDLLEIINMQGQTLRKETILPEQKRLAISFSQFTNGIYLVNIINTGSNSRIAYKINKSK